MAKTCPHGYAPSDCLICEALGANATDTATASSGRAARSARRGRNANGGLTNVVPSQVLATDHRGVRRRGGGMSLAAIGVGLVVAVIAAVLLAGVVFTVLRVFELVLVALAAGWVGYHVGLFRGSRRR